MLSTINKDAFINCPFLTQVHVTLTDINDNAPLPSMSRVAYELEENMYTTDTLVAEIKATDEDIGNNARIHMRITEGNIGERWSHTWETFYLLKF